MSEQRLYEYDPKKHPITQAIPITYGKEPRRAFTWIVGTAATLAAIAALGMAVLAFLVLR